jgi:hypothetical protein
MPAQDRPGNAAAKHMALWFVIHEPSRMCAGRGMRPVHVLRDLPARRPPGRPVWPSRERGNRPDGTGIRSVAQGQAAYNAELVDPVTGTHACHQPGVASCELMRVLQI